jgi:aarF domain-containing kinase
MKKEYLLEALRRIKREKNDLNLQLEKLRKSKSTKFIFVSGALGVGCVGTYLYNKKEFDFMGQAVIRSTRTLFTALKVSLDYRKSLHRWWDRGGPGDDWDFASDLAYQEARRECNLRTGQALLHLFQKNAGIYIKLGQHLSALEYILPPEFCAIMAVLQNEAPQSSIEDVEKVLREDFDGRGIEDLFVDFDLVPVGAASLAQVHIAKLRETGEAVAVKIQHHSIKSYAEVDMFVVSLAVRAIKYFFPEFEFDWLADEMKLNLPKELDFIQEAHNSERVLWNFTQNSSRYPEVLKSLKIPRVMWKQTTARVLTMEYCPGAKVTDLEFMHQNNIDPYEVSARLAQIFSEMIFIHGFVHCDPHPGNVFIRLTTPPRRWWPFWTSKKPTWELVLLDHGLYRELPADFRLAYARLWKSVIEGDVEKIKEACRDIGAGDAYRLFSSVLTHRTWSSVSVRSISTQTTLDEIQLIKERAPGYLIQVADFLAKIPRPLLLLLKTNDLLRAIERILTELGDRRPVQSFFITTRYCADAIYLDGLSNPSNSIVDVVSLYFSRLVTLFRVNAFEFLIRLKINIIGK